MQLSFLVICFVMHLLFVFEYWIIAGV